MNTVAVRLRELLSNSPNTYTQAEIANYLGISRQRIGQILIIWPNLRPLFKITRTKGGKYHCVDCGRQLHNLAQRCRTCYLQQAKEKRQ